MLPIMIKSNSIAVPAKTGTPITPTRRAVQFLLSKKLSAALGVIALVAVLWHDATGTHAAWLAVTVTLWAAQLCAMAAVDIEKGGEL